MTGRDLHAHDLTLTTPEVSVIIPSYNSSSYIRQCLSTLRKQKSPYLFEMILVDSSFDGTERIVAEEFPEVRLFHFQERCSVGKARNIGVKKARGSIILFLDTDCIPEAGWIDLMANALQEHEVDGVGGAVENGTPRNLMGSVGFYLEFFRFLGHKGSPSRIPFFMGGNSGFRKEVCEAMPFHDLSVGDDFLFAWNMAQRGKVLLFVPSAVVRHMNKTGWRRVLGYQHQLGKGACLYRQTVSPTLSTWFQRLPLAIFLTPPLVMLWISGIVLKRRSPLGWAKFFPLIPVLCVSHLVWAWGFFLELWKQNRINSAMPSKTPSGIVPLTERV